MEITVGISLRTSGDCASSSSFIEDMLYAESWQSHFLEKSHRGRSGRFAIKEQNHEFMAALSIQTYLGPGYVRGSAFSTATAVKPQRFC